ncbi:SMI1/KNR4 family protein [Actinospica durhamensis]|uniref:SMI1/KNR4 family protein n=1 Tax=Actinospica durhamensis TaxID=1508375 RepID=A0A941IR77_9ACTN|nr:SMI1/KNR4 family protein [Actinospica durhamensis]MBR7837059.1 SMI1/KNR4 family protein [Actinospica durhamensis]
MDLGEWPEFLARWSGEWIDAADSATRDQLPVGTVERRWLGFDGATQEQLAAAEARLGCVLPPSYREFLAVTNGWLHAAPAIYRLGDTDSVGWFRELEPEWCAIWSDNDEHEILARSLCISTEGDSGVFLLDPGDVGTDGEWAAYHFANWYPGLGDRAASFRALMDEEYATFHYVLEPDNATSRGLDAQCAGARAAIMSGDLITQVPILDEAVTFGRIGAQVTRIQIDALLGDWTAVRERTMSLLPNRAEHLIGEALLSTTVIPLFLLAMYDWQEQQSSTKAYLIDNSISRSPAPIPAQTAEVRAAIDTAAFAPSFLGSAFNEAVAAARQLATAGLDDEAWQRIADAVHHWRPAGPHDVAPAALLADSVLGRLITPARGHEILTTPRGPVHHD